MALYLHYTFDLVFIDTVDAPEPPPYMDELDIAVKERVLFNIVFKTKGVTAIKRSERGIVALVIKDDTEGGKPMEVFKSVTDIDFTKFTKRNYEY